MSDRVVELGTQAILEAHARRPACVSSNAGGISGGPAYVTFRSFGEARVELSTCVLFKQSDRLEKRCFAAATDVVGVRAFRPPLEHGDRCRNCIRDVREVARLLPT